MMKRSKYRFLLLCFAVFLLVFGLSYTVMSQAPGDDAEGPGNVGNNPAPGDNPTPGNPGDEEGPVATVNDLNEAISSGDLDVLKEILETGIDPNTDDDLGYTPLATVVTLSQGIQTSYGQAQVLLAAGADPNRQDDLGITPIHHAARHGSESMMNVPLAGGGSPNLSDNRGETPYELALKWGNQGAVSAIESASDFRHPDRENLVLWGLFSLQVRAYLKTQPEAGSERDAKVREINNFLVENGLIAAEDKAAFDAKSISDLNNCCGQETEEGN